MPHANDQSRCLAPLEQDCTIIAVIEMSQSSWLVAGIVPGIERQPLKKLEPDKSALLRLLRRWRNEAATAGRMVTRIAVAFEAGRDGFWLSRWLRAHGAEAYVIHPASVAVAREHRRAKTDRLDTGLLKRAFLGWLRGERGHCSMAASPRSRRKTPNARAVSARAWSGSGPHREPDEGHSDTPGHPQLQADVTQRGRVSADAAHCGGRAPAAEHVGRAAAGHGASALRLGPDQGV
jgi:hypothetical protein